MKEGLFLFLLGFLCLPVITVWPRNVAAIGIKPDLALILVVWAAMRSDSDSSIIFAFLLGLAMDFLSGTPTGLLGIVYCTIAWITRYANALISVDGQAGRTLMVLLAALFVGCCVLSVRRLNGAAGYDHYVLWLLLAKSATTAIISMAFIPVTDRIWKHYDAVLIGR